MREPLGGPGRRPTERLVTATVLGLLLLTPSCGREITGPAGALSLSAPIALLTQFRQLPGQASLQSGVEFATLRATLLRLNGSVALDRVVDYPSTSDSIALDLTAPLGPGAANEGERMLLLLRFITASGDTVFRSGPDSVLLEPATSGATRTPVVVEPEYVGPGSQATRVVLSQSDVTVTGTAGSVFSAQAFDAQNAVVPNAPILFTSSDTTLVRFVDARSGTASTTARRDSARVFASLLTGPSDTAIVRVTLPATAMAAVSGNAQSGLTGAALAEPVRVRVTASDAVGVEGVAVSFAVTEGAVDSANVLTNADGEAITTWTLGASVGTQTLTASAAGLSGSPVAFAATALSGAAVSLEFTANPVSAVAGLTLGTVTVTARDAQANVATTFSDSVTLSIGTNVAGGVLSGVKTVAAVDGVAVFTGLSIDRVGAGYTLAASASGLTAATSAAFDIAAGEALSLVFVVQPPSVSVNTVLTPAVQVEARDAFGNRATGFTGDVTVAFDANPGGATLGGTLTVAAAAGLVTFADLSVNAVGIGYMLTASAVSLTGATSAAFDIAPGAAVSLAFVVQPPSVSIGTTLTPSVQVEARDQFGNRATGFAGDVTVAFGANPGGATLGGTLTVAAAAGLVTFADLSVNAIGAGYTLTASAVSLTGATSTTFSTLISINAWTNAAGGTWSNTANWSLGRLPVAADSVVIALAGTYTVTMDTNFTGSYLTVGSSSGTQTLLLSSRTLTLSDAFSTTATGVLNATNSVLNGSGNLQNTGTLMLRGTNVALPLTNAGLLVANASNDFTAAATTTEASVIRLQPDGSTAFSTLGFLLGINNQGLIELTSTVAAFSAALTVSGGALVNAASGVINSAVGSGGLRSITAAVSNAGSITVNHPLTWNGVSTTQANTGSIAVNANLHVVQTGTTPSFTNSGNIAIAATTMFRVSGGSFTESGAGITGNGTLLFENLTGAFAQPFVTGSLTVSLVNAELTGTGSVTNSVGQTTSTRGSAINIPFINDGLVLVDGTNSFGSSVSTTSTSIIRLAGSGSTGFANLTAAGFVNHGSIELTSTVSSFSAQLSVSSGTLVNSASGSISSLVGTGGSRTLVGSIDNQGTLVVNQPLVWNSANVAIVNSGTLDVAGGNLTINQTGSAQFSTSGTVNIGTGRSMLISGGSIAQSGGAFTGSGVLNFVNASVVGTDTLVNPATRTLTMRAVAVSAPLRNSGTLIVDGTNSIQGAFVAPTGSTLRLLPTGSTGFSTLTVASGFSNAGLIELSSSVSSFGATLIVSTGTLVNELSGVIRTAVGTGGTRSLTAAVSNFGLIDIDHPLTWSGVSVAQVNDGSITVDANLSIVLSGTTPSFANLGSITVAASRTMSVTGGTFTQTPTSIDGSGNLSFTDVNLSLPTAFSLAGFNTSMVNTTVSGAGSLTNPSGVTLSLRGSTISVPMTNSGVLSADGTNSITGSVTTSVGSTIRTLPAGSTGFSNLSVAGFLNSGAIELSSSVSSFSSTITVASGTLVNAAGGSITTIVGTGGPRTLNGSVDNQGTITVHQPLTWNANNANITNAGNLDVLGGNLLINQTGSALFTLSGTVEIAAARSLTITGGSFTQSGGAITGTGALLFTSLTVTGPGTFVNPVGRTVTLRGTSITAPITNAGTLDLRTSSSITGALTTVSGSLIRVGHDGSSGNNTLTVGSGFTNFGTIELTSDFSSFNSVIDLGGLTLTNSGGGAISVLRGTGGARSIVGSVDNQGQFAMSPDGATALSITGSFINSGSIDMGLGGLGAGSQYDQISVGGTVTLDGTLNVILMDAFVPVSPDSFTLITSVGPVSGSFATTNLASPLASSPTYGANTVIVFVPSD